MGGFVGVQRGLNIWLAVAPFIALSLFAFAFIVHEELFKGVALLRLHPIEA